MIRRNNSGFSLVELIIVVAIMAILIGVLAPQYVRYVEKSRKAADEDLANTLLTVGYLMTSDEDIAVLITAGDKITLTATGITPTEQAGTPVTDSLNEYVPGWNNKQLISNTYKSKSYVVEFKGGDGTNPFTVDGAWSP